MPEIRHQVAVRCWHLGGLTPRVLALARHKFNIKLYALEAKGLRAIEVTALGFVFFHIGGIEVSSPEWEGEWERLGSARRRGGC
jgi:hypothetical protein